MQTIEATYLIVTPMFIGGADQTPDNGIRPPSFKGALRFWWRALNWGECYSTAGNNEAKALKLLHQREADIFGAAAKEDKGGQGKFLLTIRQHDKPETLNDWPETNTGAGYLAYGILESKGGKSGKPHPHKIALREGTKFTASFIFRPNTTQHEIISVRQAAEALGLLGGLGSRNRRGMGSVTLEVEGGLSSLAEYEKRLKQLFQSFSVTPAPFTAFSSQCSHKILTQNEDARKALDKAGGNYKAHRAEIINDRNSRISFGLPLQDIDTETRRASSLFFHVHALSKGKYVSILAHFPSSQFHHKQRYQNIDFEDVRKFVGAHP